MIRIVLPLVILMLILVACAPAPNLRDEAFLDDVSLISGEPCQAPCWQNLVPGETAWGVAQSFITDTEDYVQVDSDSDRRTGEAWIEFAFKDGPKCCRVYTADGTVLSSILLLLSPQMTLGEVVDTFREPEYMAAQAETSDQAYVALIYPETPMVIYVFAENITDSELAGTSDVIGLVYMSQDEMQTLITTQNLYNWNGYGVLGDVIDGEFDITPVPQSVEETE